MNYDAWSAWNNALVVNGRDDAMPCPWPAQGYGRFVGTGRDGSPSPHTSI